MVAERVSQKNATAAMAGAMAQTASPVPVARPGAVQRPLRAISGVCRNGHVRTATTTHIRPNGWLRCRVCAADSVRLRAREAKAREVLPTVCRAGHRQTFRTAFRDKAGALRCRPCLQEWGRTHGTGGSAPRDRCRSGHPLVGENVGRTNTGARFCRTCRRSADRRNAARRRAARKATQTSQGTAFVLPAPHSAPERPLEGFDAIAAAVADKARAYMPTRYADLVEVGIRERRAREATKATVPVTPERIIEAAAGTFGVTVADLTGKDRHVENVWPRQLAMFLMRELCPGDGDGNRLGVMAIGRALNRDHTTALYGLTKVERLVAAGDRETVRDLELVREALGATA